MPSIQSAPSAHRRGCQWLLCSALLPRPMSHLTRAAVADPPIPDSPPWLLVLTLSAPCHLLCSLLHSPHTLWGLSGFCLWLSRGSPSMLMASRTLPRNGELISSLPIFPGPQFYCCLGIHTTQVHGPDGTCCLLQTRPFWVSALALRSHKPGRKPFFLGLLCLSALNIQSLENCVCFLNIS